MRKLVCDGCGAALKNTDEKQANIKCEYCGTYFRVIDKGERYDSQSIINQIFELGINRVRDDSLNEHYERAKKLIENNKLIEANKLLNDILEKDSTQARAWFYKSLLPVLEQESILFRGHYVNIRILSHLVKREHISEYLRECGLTWYNRRQFMNFYRSTNFLYEQRLKFLDKAIEYASTPERKEFFEKQKKEAIKEQTSKLRRRFFANFLLIGLLMAVIAGAIVVIVGEVIKLG